MDEPSFFPEVQERNRRLFGGMVGWLLGRGRRPGMLGAAVAFVGRAHGSQARLERTKEGWIYRTGEIVEELDPAGVLQLVGSGDFFPRTVEVVPDLAELLFMEAVHQAEESLIKVNRAAPHIEDLATTGDELNVMAWVMATTELDRALRAGITSVVLAIASGEALVNAWADEAGGWRDDEDRRGVAEKCVALARRSGVDVGVGSSPYQELNNAVKKRNNYVHSRRIPEPVAAIGARAPRPGWTTSVEARATCLAIRRCFVDLARHLDRAPPRYLAHCPDADPADDLTWGTATILTGVRKDTDFPRLGADDAPAE